MFALYINRGVSTMEVVAMDMKLRGMYVARQLSFQGVTFKVEKIPLTEDFILMYNDSVALVSGVSDSKLLLVTEVCHSANCLYSGTWL